MYHCVHFSPHNSRCGLGIEEQRIGGVEWHQPIVRRRQLLEDHLHTLCFQSSLSKVVGNARVPAVEAQLPERRRERRNRDVAAPANQDIEMVAAGPAEPALSLQAPFAQVEIPVPVPMYNQNGEINRDNMQNVICSSLHTSIRHGNILEYIFTQQKRNLLDCMQTMDIPAATCEILLTGPPFITPALGRPAVIQ
ncbi:unnamed protein product [Mytilus coruscus]|uniref:Uncharacterized protein n=1 Tax=Mytilus coruscus TaxID=42192 RepID=A0A6J8DAA3_MYTCO|nr:unnamed protein product [Mytilus coruscus]